MNRRANIKLCDKENILNRNYEKHRKVDVRMPNTERVTYQSNNRAALGSIENVYYAQARPKSTSTAYDHYTAANYKTAISRNTTPVLTYNKPGKFSAEMENVCQTQPRSKSTSTAYDHYIAENYKTAVLRNTTPVLAYNKPGKFPAVAENICHTQDRSKSSSTAYYHYSASNYETVVSKNTSPVIAYNKPGRFSTEIENEKVKFKRCSSSSCNPIDIIAPIRLNCSPHTTDDFSQTFRSKNVTNQRSWCADPDYDDNVFVNGRLHGISQLVGLKSPPFEIASPTHKSKENKRTSSRKSTLINKLCRRASEAYYIGYDQWFSEYLEEIYDYLISQEYILILRNGYLQNYNNSVHQRAVIVDWLLGAQQKLEISESAFMSAVRLMDLVLSIASVKPQKFILVAAACLWMMVKYDSSSVSFPASKIVTLCGQNFTSLELLSLERKIFRSMRYNLRIDEPLEFLYYYIKHLKLQNNLLIIYASHYVLETYTLFPEYSTTSPCLLAVATLYAILAKWRDERKYDLLIMTLKYYEPPLIINVADNIRSKILQAVNPNFKMKASFNKYSSDLKLEASRAFTPNGF